MAEPAPISHVRFGGTTVTYLPDGVVRTDPLVAFPDTAQADWDCYPDLLDGDGRLVVSVGSFLIRNEAGLTLIDLGLGDTHFEVPAVATYDGGRLLTSLSAENLSPADIDFVLFTHLHRDHVGWAGDGTGALTFGNARHIVDEQEWNHWRTSGDPTGPDPETVLAPLTPVIEFFDARVPVPGIRALPTPGHTPGHTSFLVTDPETDENVLILGDAMHTRAQLENLDWTFRSDHDTGLASRQRADLHGHPAIAGGHFSGSVFGRSGAR
ncbi:MBL fold metallo-hydrolase [Actinoplanes sp. HUAS TT8]|uniref:MBL fold metallo-hydrolase n=1 Tax=Actinoplanes sp. HUAS TT8 TaxID=3447453 RepID=UPI003F51D882